MKKISLVAAAALLFAGVSLQAQGTKQDSTHAKKAAVTHHAKKASAKQAGTPADSTGAKKHSSKKHSSAKKDTTAKKG